MTDEAVKPESPYSPHFTFRTFANGTDSDNEERIFALRYQVYCLERSFLQVEDYPNGLESDEFDAYSTHIGAYSLTDLLVGGLRLVTPPDGERFPFQDHCTQLFANRTNPPNHKCTEVSRLVISKLYRRRAGDTVFGVPSQLLDETPVPPPKLRPSQDAKGRFRPAQAPTGNFAGAVAASLPALQAAEHRLLVHGHGKAACAPVGAHVLFFLGTDWRTGGLLRAGHSMRLVDGSF